MFVTTGSGVEPANIDFTLSAVSDYPAPLIKSAGVVANEKADGYLRTIFFLYLSGSSPKDIASCVVQGTSGESYDLSVLLANQQRSLTYLAMPGEIVDNGTYTFTVTDRKGRSESIVKSFTRDETVPSIDEGSRLPVDGAYVNTTTPTLSFTPLEDPSLLYKFYIMDYGFKAIWWTNIPGSEAEITVPEGLLQPYTPYYWFVRVMDSQLNNAQDSQMHRFYTGDDTTSPQLDTMYVIDVQWPGGQMTWLGARDTNVAPWDIDWGNSHLTATAPDGNLFPLDSFSYYFSKPFTYGKSVYDPYPLGDGFYDFSLTSAGETVTGTVPAFTSNPLPFFDECSLSPGDNAYLGSDSLTFSWAPLFDSDQPDRTYYYRVRVYDYTGKIKWYDSPITTTTSITIPVAGNFAVGNSYLWRLYAYDDDSLEVHNETLSELRTLTIADAPIIANFTQQPIGSDPGSFSFSDTSSGNVAKWFWDFGDGTTSTERNPQHEYAAPGCYQVSLAVTDFYGNVDTKVSASMTSDFNGDGDVDGLDLALAAAGQVMYDLSQLAQNFGSICQQPVFQ